MTLGHAKPEAQLPPVDEYGFHPTLNQFGWSNPDAGWLLQEFVSSASSSPLWSLDVGCAYGFHTAQAIKAGARVVANDLSADHLRIAAGQIPEALSLNFVACKGAFNRVKLPEGAFGVIMASNVMHFMAPSTIEGACRKMFELLAPGGKVLVGAQTPYVGTLKNFIPVYEQRKCHGEKWPGFIRDPSLYIPNRSPYNHGLAHLLEPEILSRAFAEAGFTVDKAEFLASQREDRKYDGRERMNLVAHKP